MWQKISSVACVIFMKNIFVPGEVDKKDGKAAGQLGGAMITLICQMALMTVGG